jgi:hypothetical protein
MRRGMRYEIDPPPGPSPPASVPSVLCFPIPVYPQLYLTFFSAAITFLRKLLTSLFDFPILLLRIAADPYANKEWLPCHNKEPT